MTTRESGKGEIPDEPEGTPPIPDEEWLKFLSDSEHAIRASAPREPSAQERAPGWHPHPRPDGEKGNTDGPERTPRSHERADAVGELWQPEEPHSGPAWGDLDARARLRRVGRVIATAAAITLALGAWSWLSTTGDTRGGQPGDRVQQLEQAPPSASPLLPGSTFTVPSSSATHSG